MIKEVENILKEANIEEYQAEAKLIVLEISNLSLEEIMLGKDIPNKTKILDIAYKRARTKKPIQHLLGYSHFMGEKFIVNEFVLIPRDETEILVKEAFELIKNKKEKLDILDIGVGSGCISCSLAKKLHNKDIEILGVDISFEAIETALENINKLNLVRKVILRKSDIYSKIRNCEKFDLIISNPPYIPIKEKENLQKEVLNFDPHLALFASDDKGIEFYEKIIKDAPKYLKRDGFLAFEIGINQAPYIENLLKENFKNIKIIKDLANIERVMTAQIKN
ncbi:MAG: peptide chain release factor N(5)-glutamine methyltransferase [Candidatus Gastranaerophilales bacterium]|nr:peptide chain release factor N(5)-glutamine methyltransferase [Candidatus Gastranaerophilales bacterium]